MAGRDFLSPAERSRRMGLVKGKGNKPEKRMALLLRAAKIRYVGHREDLPGKPDFALRERRVAVFVDGGFWHGRDFAEWRHKLDDYWTGKITRNMRRDRRVYARLRRLGWSVVRLWEEEVLRRPEWCVSRVRRAIERASAKDSASPRPPRPAPPSPPGPRRPACGSGPA